MFGGLLKSTSLAALVAVAGVALSGVSAQAADLGGNCCADLEERIAELEATTARKGNRKVSLTVSGHVNEGILFFDDGVERNAYVATNEQARSRFRFLGSAKIDANWSAGYLLEIGVRGNPQFQLSQNTSAGAAKGLDVRHSAWWLQNKDLGKVWVGQTSQATDGITEINLANTGHFASAQYGDYINSFFLRGANGNLSTVTIAGISNQAAASQGSPGEGGRLNLVKYETPTLAGFTGSAAWGEDDFWDVALRYAGEFSGIKLAAGIGYQKWNDANTNPRQCTRRVGTGSGVSCDELGVSGSVMHVPTGLFVSGAYGYKNDDFRQLLVPTSKKKDDFYFIQAGIEQSFFPIGKSTLFGEYINGSYGASVNAGSNSAAATTPAAGNVNGAGVNSQQRTIGGGLLPGGGLINSTDISVWGVGFNQNIAAAAMDIYVSYRNYDFEVKDAAGNKALLNDLQTFVMGARIQF